MYLKKTKCMVMMSMNPSAKILKFIVQKWPNSENVLNLRKAFS